MKVAFALYILAIMDAAFIGYRAAAGRNAFIFKTSYYGRAVWRGVVAGHIALLLVAAIIFSSGLLQEFLGAGQRMLIVYLPYTFVIIVAFAFRLIPAVDIRSFTSTLIFAPFVLIRPLFAIAGVVWGALGTSHNLVWFVGGLILIIMLSLESILNKLFYSVSPHPFKSS